MIEGILIGALGTFILMFAWAFGCFLQGWHAANHEWIESSKDTHRFVTVHGKSYFATEVVTDAPLIEDESEHEEYQR